VALARDDAVDVLEQRLDREAGARGAEPAHREIDLALAQRLEGVVLRHVGDGEHQARRVAAQAVDQLAADQGRDELRRAQVQHPAAGRRIEAVGPPQRPGGQIDQRLHLRP
jgi:hypothetical protein